MTREKQDRVNHPDHYMRDPSGVECITITRHRNFNVGNAIKYLWRAGLKHPQGVNDLEDPLLRRTLTNQQIEDLEKARWYIDDEIQRLRDEEKYAVEGWRDEKAAAAAGTRN